MSKESIYTLDLHETYDIDNYNYVMRVPGGWVYHFVSPRSEAGDYAIFVPFDNRFCEDEAKRINR